MSSVLPFQGHLRLMNIKWNLCRLLDISFIHIITALAKLFILLIPFKLKRESRNSSPIFRGLVGDLKCGLSYFNYVCFDSTLWAILILRCVSIEKFMNKPTFLAHIFLMKHSTLVCEIFFFQVLPTKFCFAFHTLTHPKTI